MKKNLGAFCMLGVGVSITILAVCKLLDDKYNKEGK